MSAKSDWAGRLGAEWRKRSDDMDVLLEEPGIAGMDALGSVAGKAVLDVGCGGGRTSRELTRRGAQVTGVDVSPDLLALARSRGGAEFLEADAGADPLGGPYEALYSRFGAMFFDDPVGGWRHIRGQMVADAPGVIVAWAERAANGWATVPMQVSSSVLGLVAPPPPGAPGPFAWSDPEFASAILRDAGWRGVEVQRWEGRPEVRAGDDPDPLERAVFSAMRIGPGAAMLSGATDAQKAEIKGRLRETLAEWIEGDAVRMPAAVWLFHIRA